MKNRGSQPKYHSKGLERHSKFIKYRIHSISLFTDSRIYNDVSSSETVFDIVLTKIPSNIFNK